MRRLCAELLSGLNLPGPVHPDALFTALCAGMSRRHDRPVSHRLVSFPAGTVSGLWVATDAQHLVLCEKDTAPDHQLVILGHELWHLEEHHRADPALSTAEAAPLLAPGTTHAALRRLAARTAFCDHDETAAETFGSLLGSRARKWLAQEAHDSLHQAPVSGLVQRLEASLGPQHPQGPVRA
ncbi:hypothetical protein M1P56_35540 (plasmid) [Streptomyces sp. HU2014]|uniref:hypothetical protein n=1 Tax=Streptomyces sp. HU2014 TaxID=2939414 RepID=UPI00200E8FDB|nr:hypothetical protein [Streptomyces sp. HU2014]UQI49703.1 hypothetical protein M1P56_35540 [Streptomyces sp. HU2014]